MEVETLGAARSLGWRVHMRCANGYRQDDDNIAWREDREENLLDISAEAEPAA
jgi:hypothetical protein